MPEDRRFFDGFAQDLIGFHDIDIQRLLDLCGDGGLGARHSFLATLLLRTDVDSHQGDHA